MDIFHAFVDSLNNRERSLFIWMILILIFVLVWSKELRKLMGQLILSLLSLRLLFIHVTTIVYVLLVTLMFYKLGLWEIGLSKPTVFWLFGTAFIFVFNNAKARGYFRNILIHSLKLTLVLEFIANLYSFPLVAELMLAPLLIFSALIKAVTHKDQKLANINLFFKNLIQYVGLAILTTSLYKTVVHAHDLVSMGNLKEFLLQPVYTVLFIPFIYVLALYLTYTEMYSMMKFNRRNEPWAIKKPFREILLTCRFNLSLVTKVRSDIFRIDLRNQKLLTRYLRKIRK